MAMATAGSDAKGDCRVTAKTASELRIDIVTKAQQLVEPGIRAVVEATLKRLGMPNVELQIEDAGALDYVLAARAEIAVRECLQVPCETLQPTALRSPAHPDRPRRSRLYAPGNNPRLLVGIEVHGADCVLLDLEDSVPVGEKAAARVLVKNLLASVAFPNEVWVRINALGLGGEDDLAEVLQGRPHGICLPKAESPDDVANLSARLAEAEDAYGIESGSTKVMLILETARGVLHCETVAAADPRVVMVAFGAEDFTRDVGARRSDRSLAFARSRVVAGAAAAGVQSSDTVYSDLTNMTGLAEECAMARELGFDGKGAINPRQLDTIHAAFSPSDEELAYAQCVVDAAAEAERSGSGAVALDGKMIDKPVLERARRLIEYSAQLQKRGDAA